MAQPRILYEGGRPYTVPETLEELIGPTSGVVELPVRLDWSEQGRYDLSDPKQLRLMYEVVIRESMTVEDLRSYLDGATLRRVWRRLWLPRKVHQLWEGRFRGAVPGSLSPRAPAQVRAVSPSEPHSFCQLRRREPAEP